MRINAIQPFTLPLLLMTAIFVLSSIPGKGHAGEVKFLTELDPQLQNLMHIPLFGILQFLWLRGFTNSGKSGVKISAACIGISSVYGIADEFHQMFVPGRYASMFDVLLNLVGIAAGTMIFNRICRRS